MDCSLCVRVLSLAKVRVRACVRVPAAFCSFPARCSKIDAVCSGIAPLTSLLGNPLAISCQVHCAFLPGLAKCESVMYCFQLLIHHAAWLLQPCNEKLVPTVFMTLHGWTSAYYGFYPGDVFNLCAFPEQLLLSLVGLTQNALSNSAFETAAKPMSPGMHALQGLLTALYACPPASTQRHA